MHYLFLCFMFLVSRPFVLALALVRRKPFLRAGPVATLPH